MTNLIGQWNICLSKSYLLGVPAKKPKFEDEDIENEKDDKPDFDDEDSEEDNTDSDDSGVDFDE